MARAGGQGHRGGVPARLAAVARSVVWRRSERGRGDRRRWIGTSALLAAQGFTRVAGADEAGRGALAGPLVAAAVILPAGFDIEGINDSKMLTRAAARGRVRAHRRIGGVGGVQGRAGRDRRARAASSATSRCCAGPRRRSKPDYVLTDGFPVPDPVPVDRREEGRRRERERGRGVDRRQGHARSHHAAPASAISPSSGSTTTRATARRSISRRSTGTGRPRAPHVVRAVRAAIAVPGRGARGLAHEARA